MLRSLNAICTLSKWKKIIDSYFFVSFVLSRVSFAVFIFPLDSVIYLFVIFGAWSGEFTVYSMH